jgi:hypothetical protein
MWRTQWEGAIYEPENNPSTASALILDFSASETVTKLFTLWYLLHPSPPTSIWFLRQELTTVVQASLKFELLLPQSPEHWEELLYFFNCILTGRAPAPALNLVNAFKKIQ